MKIRPWNRAASLAVLGAGLLIGCSESQEPAMVSLADAALASDQVIIQDLTQLSNAGIPAATAYGVFSIGWDQFVGPAIQDAGTLGKAFAVIHADTPQSGIRPASIDVGTITLTYTGGSVELVKRTSPGGNVMYSTFDRGLRTPESLPVNIPFVGGGEYVFGVGGSAAFAPASFSMTAPPSLIELTTAADLTVNLAADLTVTWTGGVGDGEVVLRVVPHLNRQQLQRPMPGGQGPRGPRRGPDGGGPGGMGPGGHQGPGPHVMAGGSPGLPPNALTKRVANTGSATLTAAELQELVNGSSASEIMVHVAQISEQVVEHEGKTYVVLLKNADRVVIPIE